MIQSTHTTTTDMEAHYIMADRYTMKSHPLPSQLTPQQETAIDLILAGKNDREVAESIGKSRSTINVWRNQDPLFMATLNDRRQQVRGSQLSRLNTLVSDAVDVLQDGLHDEDIKVRIVAAVHILKATGVYGAERRARRRPIPQKSQPTMRRKRNCERTGAVASIQRLRVKQNTNRAQHNRAISLQRNRTPNSCVR